MVQKEIILLLPRRRLKYTHVIVDSPMRSLRYVAEILKTDNYKQPKDHIRLSTLLVTSTINNISNPHMLSLLEYLLLHNLEIYPS